MLDISQQNLIPFINLALTAIYQYWSTNEDDPVLWDFMLKREAYKVQWGMIDVSLQTAYPVYEVKAFHCGKMPVEKKFKEGCCLDNSCNCMKPLPECKCGCIDIDICWCDCDDWCGEMTLVKKSAKWKLCWDSYQIVWWPCWFWWFWWQIIKVNLDKERCNCDADGLWVEYYSWFNKIKCMDNKFPLPDTFMFAFLYILQSLLLMRTDPEESAIMYNRFLSQMKVLRKFQWNTLYSITYGK